MNFFKFLEGPELKTPSLHDEPEPRALGFHAQPVQQPSVSWFPAPSPDGSDSFLPFKLNQTAKPFNFRRKFGNDENS